MEERPPPSAAKLLSQFQDWNSGNEMPGRTMSYLKTGYLPDVLAELESTDGVESMLAAWQQWEAGSTNPAAVLEILRDSGLEAVLAALTEA